MFDREASVEKACRLAREAGDLGARLVLLPESFIPAYPRGFSFGAVVGSRSAQGRALWQRYWENSVDVPGRIQKSWEKLPVRLISSSGSE